MKSISFVNFKGGVTKTSSTVGLGAALARKGHKILLVDCDPQGHLSVHLGINREELSSGLENILSEKHGKVSDIIVETSQKNLFLAPSRRGLLHSRNSLANRNNRDAVLAKALRGLEDYFHYILFDTPPDEGILATNAMYASRFIIVPTLLDSLSLDGINPLIDTILALKDSYEDKQWDILGVLVNKYDRRLITENKENLSILEDAFGDSELIFKTKIRVDEGIRKAQRKGQTIFQLNSKSKGSSDFTSLAEEIDNHFNEIGQA